jgi:hypothetical protein
MQASRLFMTQRLTKRLCETPISVEGDALIPDPLVCREFNITSMSLWKWTRDPNLSFPPVIKIRKRNYRSRKALDAFKARLMRKAISRHKSDADERRTRS